MDKKLFREVSLMLCAALGYEIDQRRAAQLDAVQTVLMFAGVSDAQLSIAGANLAKSFRPKFNGDFPVPADWLAACGVSDSDLAQTAISAVKWAISRHGAYDSVAFNDPALHSTIRRFGGWTAVCEWTETDWGMKTKQFVECYLSAKRGGDTAPRVLLGIHDQNNLMAGYHKFVKTANLIRIEGGQMTSKAVLFDPIKDADLALAAPKSNDMQSISDIASGQFGIRSGSDIVKRIADKQREARKIEYDDAGWGSEV